MRSSVLAAIFAAGALAAPYEKRDVVTDIDVVYHTQLVTVTAGAELAAETAPASTSSAHFAQHQRGGRNRWWWYWNQPSTTTATSSAAPTTATSSFVEPTTTEVSSAAPTTSTSSFVEPTSSEAPSSTNVASSTDAAPTSTAATSTSPASGALATTYQEIVVLHHNVHRQNHSSPDLEWDDGLASTAQKIAESCVYAHNTNEDGGGYGQNIAAGVPSDNVSSVITELFYNGEVGYFADLYGQAQPSMSNFAAWGHFSQIVWAGTTRVGCYTQHCSGGLGNVGGNVSPDFTVCNYKSPGNYANQYASNIQAPLNNPTVRWHYGLAQ